jgi:hypothetical protein
LQNQMKPVSQSGAGEAAALSKRLSQATDRLLTDPFERIALRFDAFGLRGWQHLFRYQRIMLLLLPAAMAITLDSRLEPVFVRWTPVSHSAVWGPYSNKPRTPPFGSLNDSGVYSVNVVRCL